MDALGNTSTFLNVENRTARESSTEKREVTEYGASQDQDTGHQLRSP